MTNPGQKYARQIRQTLPGDTQGNAITVDLYDILNTWPVSAALQHAVKKLLMPGSRGHKDREADLREAIYSIERELQSMAATPDDPPPAPNSPPFQGEVKGFADVELTGCVEVSGIAWLIHSGDDYCEYRATGNGWNAKIVYNTIGNTLCLWRAYVSWGIGHVRPAVDRSFAGHPAGLRDAQDWVARQVNHE
jgi:hypothetical protein